MKLNPPETAPKDRVIIVHFGYPFLLPAIWCSLDSAWIAAFDVAGKVVDNEWEVNFENETFRPDEMHGWLPMPQIDDEGNVVWPTALPA